MTTITFDAPVFKIDSWTVLRLPEAASAQLPSRGLTMVTGIINNYRFQAALEPDGMHSHWLHIDDTLSKATGLKAGDTATVSLEPSKEWPEPLVPADLQVALAASAQAHSLWTKITPMARWDWIRWVRSTKQAETRKRRIEVACSKLEAGTRRPCCFNRTECTEPAVSKNGVLLIPATV